MNLRRFTDSGIREFKRFLAAARANPDQPIPHSMLTDSSHSEEMAPRVPVLARHFSSRRDAATYLTEVLALFSEAVVSQDDGLWTWLSLFYFDEVCPPNGGKRTVRNDYTYVLEHKNSRHFYRHLLFIAWYTRCKAGTFNRLFLNNSLSSLDKVTSEVMKRLYLTRIPCIFEVLDRLYWDPERDRVRIGMVSPESERPGDLIRRFPIRMRQLEKTYDLHTLNADQLIELLGEEFQFNGKSSDA